jgi:hypothetical protein
MLCVTLGCPFLFPLSKLAWGGLAPSAHAQRLPYLCLIIAQLAILELFYLDAQACKELFPANAHAS